jgi:hypothetical protein
MARILVFAIDWVPERDDPTSGGGLRSLQVIEALRGGGHDVRHAVPSRSRAVKKIKRSSPERLRQVDIFETEDQVELIRRHAPDLVVWLWPSARCAPFGVGHVAHLCDLNGLQDFERANGTAALRGHASEIVASACLGADMLLTGSPEQHGYWLARLGEGAQVPPATLAPYALPACLLAPVKTGVAKLRDLHVIGNIYAWNAAMSLLERAARWAAARGDVRLRLIGGIDPGGATHLRDLEALSALASEQAVEVLPETGFHAAMQGFGPGSLCLDLYEPGTERNLAVPIRTVNALTHGVPVLTMIDSPFTQRMARAGAAVIVPAPAELERSLTRLADLPPEAFAAMGDSALAFARQEFDAGTAGRAICDAAAQAITRRAAKLRSWSVGAPALPALGHVLVVTGEAHNLRELRVDVPFNALHRRRLITGYSVWHDDQIVFSTQGGGVDPHYDAIWVQRSTSPEIALLLDALGLPFVYDIDDNLLVSPNYRPAFAPEQMQAARNFVRRAAVLSCSTQAMATILERHASTALLHKTIVTQNLLRNAPAARPSGEPSCVVWVSSDTPALTEGRLAVVKAVRDFCLTHGLRLIFIGADPPDLLRESNLEVEHMGLMAYPNYLEMLRAMAPAILVCPLEIAADAATQDFVNCKSDIKMLEALGCGLVAVCSAARPYLESDLASPILCDNDYGSWFEGLRRAKRACLEPDAAPAIAPHRLATGTGTLPFFEALSRARLPRPLAHAEWRDRLRLIESRLAPVMAAASRFNEDYYLAKYPDVQEAVQAGDFASGYAHYETTGFGEGRMAHERDVLNPNAEQWWANLMNSLSDLRTGVETRQRLIEELKTRRATRLRMQPAQPGRAIG